MTEDLVAWLREQLDEDERDIEESRALSQGELHWAMPSWLHRERLLAEVATRRAILNLHPHRRFAEPVDSRPNAHPDDRREAFAEDPKYVGCTHCNWDYRFEEVTPSFWCATVRLLAAPYADRAGYVAEWAPTK